MVIAKAYSEGIVSFDFIKQIYGTKMRKRGLDIKLPSEIMFLIHSGILEIVEYKGVKYINKTKLNESELIDNNPYLK